MSVVLIIGIILFIGLIIVHEFGHFIVARRNGVDVEEFGIFFPPRLFKHKTKAGWDFTINVLPLGGFVKLKGEHDADEGPGSFGSASTWAKAKIMVAGVFMNFITAIVLLTILALIGMPKLIPNQFSVKSNAQIAKQETLIRYVLPHSPAAQAGLKAKDQLTAIGIVGHKLQPIVSEAKLPAMTKADAGQLVNIIYYQNGVRHHTTTRLLTQSVVSASLKTNNPKGYLGIIPLSYVLQRYTWAAPIVALGLVKQVTILTLQGLGHALAGLGGLIAGLVTNNHVAQQHGQVAATSQVTGPVGIFVILKETSALGYQFMLFIVAIISLTLAIMNILPIPALDGGRLWLILISRIFKKTLSQKTEEIIVGVGFIVLIILAILITISDINRYF